MKTKLKPCQCGCDTVEIIHIPGKRQMILTCPKCRITINHKYIRMNPDELRQAIVKAWNTRPTEDALQSRITELEKQAVVWHKYPDEKPEPSYEYEVNIPVIIYSMNGCTYFADYNIDSGNFWRYGGKENNVSHWAYLPEAPKEEK